MFKYKNIILILLLSVCFTKTDKITSNVDKNDDVQVWEDEEKAIDNPELKKALQELREDYSTRRSSIKKDYHIKIEPLKQQRDIDFATLKKIYISKRQSLKDKYGVKRPSNIKKAKINQEVQDRKKLPKKNPQSKKPPLYKAKKYAPDNKKLPVKKEVPKKNKEKIDDKK